MAAGAAAALALVATDAAAAAETYFPLEGVAVEEGETLAGPIQACDLACCQAKCDADPKCHSISVLPGAHKCYLKDRCLTPDEPVKINKYQTWFKPCAGAPVADPTAMDPRFQSAITATPDDTIDEILRQLHAFSMLELCVRAPRPRPVPIPARGTGGPVNRERRRG